MHSPSRGFTRISTALRTAVPIPESHPHALNPRRSVCPSMATIAALLQLNLVGRDVSRSGRVYAARADARSSCNTRCTGEQYPASSLRRGLRNFTAPLQVRPHAWRASCRPTCTTESQDIRCRLDMKQCWLVTSRDRRALSRECTAYRTAVGISCLCVFLTWPTNDFRPGRPPQTAWTPSGLRWRTCGGYPRISPSPDSAYS